MTSIPLYRVIIGWVVLGAVRVLLGDSTGFAAYVFFGLFWVVSAVLLLAALWQLFNSRELELRVEAACVCVGVGALFLQGLFGHRSTAPVAALIFFLSAVNLLILYGRRARRRRLIEP
jgi:succinate-acetate transporter protein